VLTVLYVLYVIYLIRYKGAYLHFEATKPDTVGYTLNHSPLTLGSCLRMLYFLILFLTLFSAAQILKKWSRCGNNHTQIDRLIHGTIYIR